MLKAIRYDCSFLSNKEDFMFKILTGLLTVIATSITSFAFCATQVECAPQLQPLFAKIQKVPEARNLIENIKKEGPIRIAVKSSHLSQQFGAFYDTVNRIVYVNPSWHDNEGEMISSILFELHNASVNSKLDHFDYLAYTGQIDKESYVKGVEYLEYVNSKNASRIVEKGIALGVFPASARMNTYENFEEHYRWQIYGGHSAYIAKNYEQLAPKMQRPVSART
jgi:hypothetical protein